MKNVASSIAFIAILGSLTPVMGQTPRPFWNIEKNPRLHDYTVVRYYAADRRLIGEERVSQPWIDIGRRRNVRKLDRRLQDYVLADSLNRVAALRKK